MYRSRTCCCCSYLYYCCTEKLFRVRTLSDMFSRLTDSTATCTYRLLFTANFLPPSEQGPLCLAPSLVVPRPPELQRAAARLHQRPEETLDKHHEVEHSPCQRSHERPAREERSPVEHESNGEGVDHFPSTLRRRLSEVRYPPLRRRSDRHGALERSARQPLELARRDFPPVEASWSRGKVDRCRTQAAAAASTNLAAIDTGAGMMRGKTPQ